MNVINQKGYTQISRKAVRLLLNHKMAAKLLVLYAVLRFLFDKATYKKQIDDAGNTYFIFANKCVREVCGVGKEAASTLMRSLFDRGLLSRKHVGNEYRLYLSPIREEGSQDVIRVPNMILGREANETLSAEARALFMLYLFVGSTNKPFSCSNEVVNEMLHWDKNKTSKAKNELQTAGLVKVEHRVGAADRLSILVEPLPKEKESAAIARPPSADNESDLLIGLLEMMPYPEAINWIKGAIDYDELLADNPAEKDFFDLLLSVIVDVVRSQSSSISIGKSGPCDSAKVKAVFLSLNRDHLQFVFDMNIANYRTGKITNPSAYFILVLFGAPQNMQKHLDWLYAQNHPSY